MRTTATASLAASLRGAFTLHLGALQAQAQAAQADQGGDAEASGQGNATGEAGVRRCGDRNCGRSCDRRGIGSEQIIHLQGFSLAKHVLRQARGHGQAAANKKPPSVQGEANKWPINVDPKARPRNEKTRREPQQRGRWRHCANTVLPDKPVPPIPQTRAAVTVDWLGNPAILVPANLRFAGTVDRKLCDPVFQAGVPINPCASIDWFATGIEVSLTDINQSRENPSFDSQV